MRSSSPQIRVIALFISLAVLAAGVYGCQPQTPPAQQKPSVSVAPAWKTVWNGSYSEHIQPIFDQHCVSCHGPERAEGGLRLDSRDELWKGGEHGIVVTPGNPRTSVLITSVDGTATGASRMPPTGPRLSDTEVRNLVVWVEAGAPAD